MFLWVTKNILYDSKAVSNWTVISSQGPKAIQKIFRTCNASALYKRKMALPSQRLKNRPAMIGRELILKKLYQK